MCRSADVRRCKRRCADMLRCRVKCRGAELLMCRCADDVMQDADAEHQVQRGKVAKAVNRWW